MASSSLLAMVRDIPVAQVFARLTSLMLQRIEHNTALPDQSMRNGVNANVAVTGSLQPQRRQMSGPGESSRARVTAAAPTQQNVPLQERPSSAAMSADNMQEQQHNLPRIVEIGEISKHTIEILQYGTVMPGQFWSTGRAIFPKGFRSRTRYWSVVEPNKLCAYISEIIDGGFVAPLFVVYVEEYSSELFVHLTPKRCWELVVEKVNVINKIFYQENKKRARHTNPFHVQKLGSIDGFDMFGLSDSTVLQDLEALDIERKSEFCCLKDKDYIEEEEQEDVGVQYHNPLERNPAPNAPLDDTTCLVFEEVMKKFNPGEFEALRMVFEELPKKVNPVEFEAMRTVFGACYSSSNGRQAVNSLFNKGVASRQQS